MMSELSYFIWNLDPVLFRTSLAGNEITLLWNGVLIAIGILLAMQVWYYLYRKEGKEESNSDSFLIAVLLAAIVGARVGYIIIDAWHIYYTDPGKLLRVWEGNFNLFGGAIGIITTAFLYNRYLFQVERESADKARKRYGIFIEKRPNQESLWLLLDRLVIVISLVLSFVRLGSFFNSDVIGKPTLSGTGVFHAATITRILQQESAIEEIHYIKIDTPLSRNGYPPSKILLTFKRLGADLSTIERYIQDDITNLLASTPVATHLEYGNTLAYRLGEEGDHFAAILYCFFIPRYPIQLIEASVGWVLFLVFLTYRTRKPGSTHGKLTVWFGILAFGSHFFTQFLSTSHDNLVTGPLDKTQLLCMFFLVISLGMWARLSLGKKS